MAGKSDNATDPKLIASLSDDEREALIAAGAIPGANETEEDDVETEALRALAEDDDDDDHRSPAEDDDDQDEDEDEDEDEDADEEGDEEEEAPAPAVAKTDTDEEDPLGIISKAPKLTDFEEYIKDPYIDQGEIDAVKAKLTTVNEKRAKLRADLADGEITQEQYIEQSDELDEQRIELTSQHTTMVSQNRAVAAREEAHWSNAQDAFFRDPKNAQFSAKGDPIMRAALNEAVKMLAHEYPTMSGPAILKHARAQVVDRFKSIDDAAPPTSKAGKDAKAKADRDAAIAKRAKEQNKALKKVPRTLLDIPAADESDEDLAGDEFSELDAMLGSDDPAVQRRAEMAMARMTPDQLARFGTVR